MLTLLAIAADYAFVPYFVGLPGQPALSPDAGNVMDVRIYRGATMYYQTLHERPLVGGFLARPVPQADRLYSADPCIAWLMYGHPRESCSPSSLRQALAKFDVTDIFMDPDDARGRQLSDLGFRQQYRDETSVVWSVPGSWR
jgi:hypothetical protein